MRRFEAIIQSETEPTTDCLWLKHGRIHWYTSQGWKPLADSDTRYVNNFKLSVGSSENPIECKSSTDIKNGISTNDFTISIYDGTDSPDENSNSLVTEKAIKEMMTTIIGAINDSFNELNSEIEVLKARVAELEAGK